MDSQRTERVCVVDEDFARRYWPREGGGSALGQRLAHGNESDDAKLFTIVGIVGAVKQAELTEPPGQGAVYMPFLYRDAGNIFVVTRTSQRPEAFAETLRKLVRATDPELAIGDIRSMETRIEESLIARRSPALLAGIFAGVALLLAAIGTYGVLSYAVAQRTREIGIRMALGAQRGQIGSQFLSLGLRLLAAGTILGLLGAWVAGRAMQSVLFGVPTLHIATLFGTALVMAAVSLVACLIPARRATKVDPMVAFVLNEMKTPNPKSQAPKKSQVASPKTVAATSAWSLELGVSLGFGAWNLELRCDRSPLRLSPAAEIARLHARRRDDARARDRDEHGDFQHRSRAAAGSLPVSRSFAARAIAPAKARPTMRFGSQHTGREFGAFQEQARSFETLAAIGKRLAQSHRRE